MAEVDATPRPRRPRDRMKIVLAACFVLIGEPVLFLLARSGSADVGRVMLGGLPVLAAAGFLAGAWRHLGLRAIRRGVQLGFLTLFVMLFVAAVFPMYSYVVPDLFLRADPLAALSATAAGLRTQAPFVLVLLERLWPSLVVIGLTILLGRAFCGWICPLGTVVDISDHYFYRRIRKKARVVWPQLKYYVLAAVLVTALFSLQLAHLFDPIPLLTRTATLVVYPITLLVKSGAAGGAAQVGDWLRGSSVGPLSDLGRDLSRLRIHQGEPVYFAWNLVALAIFVGVLASSAYGRRFWCRNICALGGLVAILGRYGLLKRRVNDACTRCMRCHLDCKMSAISEEVEGTILRECILCWDCVDVCPHEANPIGFHVSGSAPRDDLAFGLTRRRLVGAVASGAALAGAAATGTARSHRGQRLLRPPGALPVMWQAGLTEARFSEEDFLATCIRCGECMKACPTHCIQPAFAEAGWEGFWTPVIVPKIGYCESKCNICGTVCPTGALRFFYIAQKDKLVIGMANINRDTCIAWYEDRDCLACDEACAYKAVQFQWLPMAREFDTVMHRRPVVDESKCVGCGQCEKACPVKPEAAIVIYAQEKKQ